MELRTWAPVSDLYVRIASHDLPNTPRKLESAWKALAPDLPFRYGFLDDVVERAYREEQRWGQVVRWGGRAGGGYRRRRGAGAGVAGSGTPNEGDRSAEGAGATGTDVVGLLSKEICWLGTVASLVAWVGAHTACQRWLNSFGYRVDLGPGPFVLGRHWSSPP